MIPATCSGRPRKPLRRRIRPSSDYGGKTPMQGGYLALLDVLGFSALVGGDISGQKVQGYLECLRRTETPDGVSFVAFSDSIILTAKGDDADAFLALSKTCSKLFLDLLKQDIPVRGAIAY